MEGEEFQMKLDSIFNQMEIPPLMEKNESDEIEEEQETCSKAMQKVANILFKAEGFNETIYPCIILALKDFPKENFFSSKF